MKILIAVDGSPCSSAALEFVRKLELPRDAGVTVVSAVPVPVMAYGSEVYTPTTGPLEQLMEDETQAHQAVVAEAERDLRSTGWVTEGRVVMGDPREAIIKIAKERGIDLIVVGSHGRTGVAKLIMGSVASHVVAHAPCSVLVVKERSIKP